MYLCRYLLVLIVLSIIYVTDTKRCPNQSFPTTQRTPFSYGVRFGQASKQIEKHIILFLTLLLLVKQTEIYHEIRLSSRHTNRYIRFSLGSQVHLLLGKVVQFKMPLTRCSEKLIEKWLIHMFAIQSSIRSHHQFIRYYFLLLRAYSIFNIGNARQKIQYVSQDISRRTDVMSLVTLSKRSG